MTKTLTAQICFIEDFDSTWTMVKLSHKNVHIKTIIQADWMNLIVSVNRWAKRNKFTRINWKDL